jgi:GINS complex subunit 1
MIIIIKDLEPPNDRYIEVRVLQECGEIITSDGDILKLSLNSFHFVKRSDVINLFI